MRPLVGTATKFRLLVANLERPKAALKQHQVHAHPGMVIPVGSEDVLDCLLLVDSVDQPLPVLTSAHVVRVLVERDSATALLTEADAHGSVNASPLVAHVGSLIDDLDAVRLHERLNRTARRPVVVHQNIPSYLSTQLEAAP